MPGGAWGAAGWLKQPAQPWQHSTARVKGEMPCSSLMLGAMAPLHRGDSSKCPPQKGKRVPPQGRRELLWLSPVSSISGDSQDR